MTEKRSYAPDPRPAKRIKNPKVMKGLHTRGVVCVLCGAPGSLHHVYPKGQGGDDCEDNLVGLCGHGTAGDHGLIESGDVKTRLDLGAYIVAERPDIVFYLLGKLGETGGREWMRRKLLVDI